MSNGVDSITVKLNLSKRSSNMDRITSVRDGDARAPVQVGLLEQAAVEERDLADESPRVGIGGEVLGAVVVQSSKEEGSQPVVSEVGFTVRMVGFDGVVAPQRSEVVLVAVEGSASPSARRNRRT